MTAPPPTPTIREHAEAILDWHFSEGRIPDGHVCAECGATWPCDTRGAARAILAALDAAEREQVVTNWDEVEWAYTDNRLVPDPASAHPTTKADA